MLLFLSLLQAVVDVASGASSISVNATSIVSGESVMVSWSGVVLDSIHPMHVVFSSSAGSDKGGDHVHHWQVQPEGASSLWVGQFSPPIKDASDVHMGSDPTSRGIATEGTPPYTVPAPVKFISGTQLSDGHHTFKVSNMREAVNWVLFSGSLTDPNDFKVLAVSAPVTLRDAAAPMHLRLSRTSSVEQMRVSWTSAQDADAAGHVVQWGAAPFKLDRVTPASSTHTYASTDLCGFPANASGFHAPGYFHEALLELAEDHQPGPPPSRLYYRVGSKEFGFSAVRSFAPPAAADPHRALSVIITADMGKTYEDGSQYHWEEPSAVNTTVHIAKRLRSSGGPGIDLVLHPGDLSYATGYGSEWDRWMAQIEPISAYVPYMTGKGNHERDFPGSGSTIGAGDSGGECGVPTDARFPMPTCAPPNTGPCIGVKHGPRQPRAAAWLGRARALREGPVGSADDGWYSFEQGPLHVVMVHTELSSKMGSRQHTFVAADLAAVDRAKTPWVILLGHRQMYAGNATAPENDLGDLEPLMVRHKVDVAFFGHMHYAQRSCPMVNATCVTTKDAAGYDAPIHAIIGNAGQGLFSFPAQRAEWSVYQGKEWGFSHMAIHNATHLTLDFYADAPLDATAPLHHSVTIERKYPRV